MGAEGCLECGRRTGEKLAAYKYVRGLLGMCKADRGKAGSKHVGAGVAWNVEGGQGKSWQHTSRCGG